MAMHLLFNVGSCGAVGSAFGSHPRGRASVGTDCTAVWSARNFSSATDSSGIGPTAGRIARRPQAFLGHSAQFDPLPISGQGHLQQCYKALVRPHLEYSATVWDPYTTKGIQAVEAVQRRAARVTLNDYQRTSSVTQMLNDLQWPLLSERRRKARLTTFYKLTHNIIKIPTSNLLKPAQGRTRGSHQYKYQPIHARTDTYKYSFFPHTIPQWNALPGPVVMAPTVESFRARLEVFPP
ncbi:hypothetical protein Bbelb_054570 [Branchiostoma belcheri]|nr:hypothetical protein Bbelb_054570 [Branchiostoma belcheri]